MPEPVWSGCASWPDNAAEIGGLLAGDHILLGPRGRGRPQRRPDAGDLHLAGRGRAGDDHPDRAGRARAPAPNATFTFFDQPGSTYECAVDAVNPLTGLTIYGPCSGALSHTVTGLLDGEHLFQVRATNQFGLVEESPAEFTWTVAVPDGEAPTTAFASTPPATTVNTDATFAFTGTDNRTPAAALTFECNLDGAGFDVLRRRRSRSPTSASARTPSRSARSTWPGTST